MSFSLDLIDGSHDPDIKPDSEDEDGLADPDTGDGEDGGNIFAFGDGFDHDILLDFDPDTDRIEIMSECIGCWTDIEARLGDDEDGNALLTLDDGSTLLIMGVPSSDLQEMHFSFADPEIPCFTPGTLVETDRGAVPVEQLAAGDLVLTRDAGLQPLVWVGRRDLDVVQLLRKPALAAVCIAAGALGNGLPLRDMKVSPQHRILFAGARAELFLGAHEVLVPALHLVGHPGITRDAPRRTSYLHILFQSHQIVLSDGIWTESFQPGAHVMSGMDRAIQDELEALFPEFASKAGLRAYAAARLSLKAHEARAVIGTTIASSGLAVVASDAGAGVDRRVPEAAA